MKKVFALVIITASVNLHAVTYTVNHPVVGVIENRFDDVAMYLEKYKIPFEYIAYKDLENPEVYLKYDVIYYPSGIESEINSSIDIRARERRIEAVTFNTEFYRIKDEKISSLLRDFVKSGKTVVCSGYSAKFLNEAFDYFTLYNDFPNMGLYGFTEAIPRNRLSNYIQFRTGTVMNYDGYWVAEKINDGEVLLEAECNTPLGMLKSVSAGRRIFRSGGEAYYVSELGTMEKDRIMRFFTVSVLFDKYSLKMKRLVKAWDQTFLDYAVDRNFSFDNGREFKLDVKKGKNTVYGFFEKGIFQVDIYSSGKKLIYSKNRVAGKFEKTLNSDSDSDIYVKIYSDDNDFDGIVILGTGAGKRIVPYFSKIRIVLAFCVIFVFVRTIIKRRKRYSGTYPEVNSGEQNG